MPVYEMCSQAGRQLARMKAHALAERDIENYGPIIRTEEELLARALYHLMQVERTKPTPETEVTDDLAAFTTAIQEGYQRAYSGLMVGYTGLKEPYRLYIEPRYATTINFDGSETEHPFCGLRELLALLKRIQEHYREEQQELLSLIQVSIVDIRDGLKRPHWIAYEVEDDRLVGVVEAPPGWDDVLLGLGLPLATELWEATEHKETIMNADLIDGKDVR